MLLNREGRDSFTPRKSFMGWFRVSAILSGRFLLSARLLLKCLPVCLVLHESVTIFYYQFEDGA